VCCRLQVPPSGESYEGNAGPTESNGSPLPDIWRESLHVTCGLTACTPGSAPGPTLGNEYGKTLPFYLFYVELGAVRVNRAVVAQSKRTNKMNLAGIWRAGIPDRRKRKKGERHCVSVGPPSPREAAKCTHFLNIYFKRQRQRAQATYR